VIGALAGDIIGSVYERHNIKRIDFPLFDSRCHFTDDTVLNVAVADCILYGGTYLIKFKEYYSLYPNLGYGPSFRRWAASPTNKPYRSIGNGSAMRVSPIGFAFDSLEQVFSEARKSAEVTHNSPEAIRGAQAIAGAIFLAKTRSTKEEIKRYIEHAFGYDLNESLDEIRRYYRFDATCNGSVPQAIIAFLESEYFEDALRKAISIGGDSDTIACMAGGIAHAFYGEVPKEIDEKVKGILDQRLNRVVSEFTETYCDVAH
jgi:ADP-ribosylglycohydrolase